MGLGLPFKGSILEIFGDTTGSAACLHATAFTRVCVLL